MIEKDIFRFVNAEKAATLQRNLSGFVRTADDPGFNPRFLCGTDVAYDRADAFVSAAVWDTKRREIVETARVVDKTAIPYVPGFLGFREGPLLVRIVSMLSTSPDVFLIDGQGVAHPRGFGVASHVGVALDKPTVGVAKSRLYGRIEGDLIIDTSGIVVGRILTAETGRKYFVSVGHRVSLDTAFTLVQNCIMGGFPVPLRRAHLDSQLFKKDVTS